MKKDALIFLEHILESIENVELFTKNVSQESFFKNKEKQSAVIRQIEVIGEAVKNIPSEFKNKHSFIPWKDIAGMRDKLMHHYFGVNLKVVWKTIKEDIPALKEEIMRIKEDLVKTEHKKQ